MRSPNNSVIRRLPLSLPVLVLTFLLAIHESVEGFSPPHGVAREAPTSAFPRRSSSSLASASATNQVAYEPIFDFSDPEQNAISKFDRIDDVIMGGISTSSLRPSSNDAGESFASWSGVCRTDGGGFCGTRTLPFKDGVPLRVAAGTEEGADGASSRDGFYLTARLTSDNEPDRRVWKLSTRVEDNPRTEQLYQSDFEVPRQDESGDGAFGDEWKTILLPFDGFRQVRGPRLVEDAPAFDPSGGLYQVGLTLSKFQMARNMTEFQNFRPGYFELQIKEIGVYRAKRESSDAATSPIEVPVTLTKKEADENRPSALKIVFPILRLFFNEKRSRKKSAAKILKEKRGLGRWGIAKFAFRRKASSKGVVLALAESLLEAAGAVARTVAFTTLKFALFYPLVAIRRTLNKLKSLNKKNENPITTATSE